MIRAALISSVVFLAACGEVEPLEVKPDAIAPQDFAILPCGPVEAARPCALIIAGGKRLLFGGASGVEGTISPTNLGQLDAVFLFSLRADDLEGLDEIRNRSWRAGRVKPLPVYGPTGIERVLSAINLTYEQADALRIVDEGIPPGGFDAAILVSGERAATGLMFDTGDVRVQYEQRPDQSLIFDIVYQGRPAVRLQKCQGEDCTITDQLSWPLRQTYFVYRHSEN